MENQTQSDLYGDVGLPVSSGADVPHAGMTGGVIGILFILIAWMYVQHKYYREQTAIPHFGVVFLVLVYLTVWLLERATRAIQTSMPGTVADFFAI